MKNKRGQRKQMAQQQENSSLADNIKEQSSQSRDFTLTVEYVESRQDKLKGRIQFKGTIVANKDLASRYVQQDLEKIKRLEREKD
jgi:hypothetical protein